MAAIETLCVPICNGQEETGAGCYLTLAGCYLDGWVSDVMVVMILDLDPMFPPLPSLPQVRQQPPEGSRCHPCRSIRL